MRTIGIDLAVRAEHRAVVADERNLVRVVPVLPKPAPSRAERLGEDTRLQPRPGKAIAGP